MTGTDQRTLAFVYDAVYPWEKGGAQKRVWELARRLADDHEVHLYGMHYWDGPEVIQREGVILHGVCEPYELYVDGRRSIPQAITFATRLARPLLHGEFDLIDCQQFPYFPCFTAKAHELLYDTPLVVTWYEVWDDYWYDYLGPKGVFGKAVERAAVRIPDVIVPISTFIRDDLEAIGRTNGLSVVENGVDYDGIQRVAAADDRWDVVYVGRLSEHKNVDLLLEAVALASDSIGRDVRSCIVGDGPEREDLERLAESLDVGDHVDFEGFVAEDDDVIARIKAASVFVLPSFREGFPNTILEANACGVPSIVVDHPENGSTAVVEDGVTGFITTPNAEAIADSIVRVLTDEGLRADLSDGAHEFGKAHDWDRIVDDLEQVYSNVWR